MHVRWGERWAEAEVEVEGVEGVSSVNWAAGSTCTPDAVAGSGEVSVLSTPHANTMVSNPRVCRAQCRDLMKSIPQSYSSLIDDIIMQSTRHTRMRAGPFQMATYTLGQCVPRALERCSCWVTRATEHAMYAC